MVILAGKIDAEKSELGIFSHKKNDLTQKMIIDSLLVSQGFTTKDYSQSLGNMIEDFLSKYDGQEDIYGACFGIAGQVDVKNGKVEATVKRQDFQVTFTEDDFKNKLRYNTVPVAFMNDMEAIGYDIFLGDKEDKLSILSDGNYQANRKDRRVLMLVSGGLGQALWYWDEKKEALSPISSEGGHTDFAAITDRQKELCQFLEEQKQKREDNSPVSYEYVLSSPGLVRIYEFMQNLSEDNSNQDANAIIEAALKGDSSCKNALDMFISIWGSQAGNLALTYNAKGGVYIGGISIPIETLKEGAFMDAFANKEGKFRSYNQGISVKVFQEQDSVLWGAAKYAIEEGFVSDGKFAIMRANQ